MYGSEKRLPFNGNQSCRKFNFVMLIVDAVETTTTHASLLCMKKQDLGSLNVFVILVIDHVVAKRTRSLILMRQLAMLMGARLAFESIADAVLRANSIHWVLHHVRRNCGQWIRTMVLRDKLIKIVARGQRSFTNLIAEISVCR